MKNHISISLLYCDVLGVMCTKFPECLNLYRDKIYKYQIYNFKLYKCIDL